MGSIRRECLDHVLVWNSRSLRQVLQRYFAYYESCRTHLSLAKDAPLSRPVQPPAFGKVIEIPEVGGLHHLYIRKAALTKRYSSGSPEIVEVAVRSEKFSFSAENSRHTID